METKVVYHLHGKTGQVTVWVNDKQNSGVVNFFLEQHLPFCSNQFHLREDGREGLKLVSKLALKKWNTNFRLGHSVQKKRATF